MSIVLPFDPKSYRFDPEEGLTLPLLEPLQLVEPIELLNHRAIRLTLLVIGIIWCGWGGLKWPSQQSILSIYIGSAFIAGTIIYSLVLHIINNKRIEINNKINESNAQKIEFNNNERIVINRQTEEANQKILNATLLNSNRLLLENNLVVNRNIILEKRVREVPLD